LKRPDRTKILTQRREGRKEKEGIKNSSLRTLRSLREVLGNESFHLCASFFFLGVFFISCATSPKAAFSAGEDLNELSLLPAGAKLYFWADTVKGRPLLEALSFNGFSGKDAAQILDKTKSAAAAVFPEEQERRFFIAASGDYPRFQANFSFAFSKGWKKQKSASGSSYWYSKDDELALALGKDLALVSNTDPFAKFPAGKAPGGFAEFRRGLVMAGWINNPSGYINSFLSNTGIPLQIPAEDFFFGAARTAAVADPKLKTEAKPSWDIIFKIRVQSAVHARSLLGLFSVARLYVLRGAQEAPLDGSYTPQRVMALLFAKPPEQEAEYLSIRIDALSEAGTALLFDMFSLYSN
jgi:hypothetical protein